MALKDNLTVFDMFIDKKQALQESKNFFVATVSIGILNKSSMSYDFYIKANKDKDKIWNLLKKQVLDANWKMKEVDWKFSMWAELYEWEFRWDNKWHQFFRKRTV